LNNEQEYIIQNDKSATGHNLILTELSKLGKLKIEIVKLIKAEKSSKEMSIELCIAVSTVQTYRKNKAKNLVYNA